MNQCRWGLYVILDAVQAKRPHAEVARQALEGGARVIQLRDKNATFEELITIAQDIRAITREFDAQFIINDNPYLAREVEADGVHLGQTDFAADIAREIIGPDKIIGLSTHTKQQALAAHTLPVNYIGVGPIYATTTKQSEWPVVGTPMIRWIKRNLTLPVVAIGGITEENVVDVVAAGADNAAIIRDLMSHDDIQGQTRRLKELITSVAVDERADE